MKRVFRLILVGGDGRSGRPFHDDVEVRRFGSAKFRGNGETRNTLAAINAGQVDLVVLMIRWIGHSEADAIRARCRRASIRCAIVTGGRSAARRQVEHHLGLVHDG